MFQLNDVQSLGQNGWGLDPLKSRKTSDCRHSKGSNDCWAPRARHLYITFLSTAHPPSTAAAPLPSGSLALTLDLKSLFAACRRRLLLLRIRHYYYYWQIRIPFYVEIKLRTLIKVPAWVASWWSSPKVGRFGIQFDLNTSQGKCNNSFLFCSSSANYDRNLHGH